MERLNDGVPAEALARHELFVQVRQSIKRDAWIPMVLDVVADIARQDEDQLDQVKMVVRVIPYFFVIALYRTMLANDEGILNHDMPGAIGDDPKRQEGVPGAKDGQSPRQHTVKCNSSRDHPMR